MGKCVREIPKITEKSFFVLFVCLFVCLFLFCLFVLIFFCLHIIMASLIITMMTMTMATRMTITMMMRVIGENQDDELKDEDPPLIELPSAPPHDFHLQDFHKPDKPCFFTIFSNLNNI